MSQVHYPYIDLTVHPELRPHVLSASAAVLFSQDLEQIYWANGEGAVLIGTPTIGAAVEGSASPRRSTIRQIQSAVDKLDDHPESAAVMRVRSGFRTKLIAFTVNQFPLPGGDNAILMVTDSLHGRRHTMADMAKTAVACLDGQAHGSAVFDAGGTAIAQSDHFGALDISEDVLKALAVEIASEEDRLIKRPIHTAKGRVPAGVARLGDDPALHLIVLAEPGEEIESHDAPAAIAANASMDSSEQVEQPEGTEQPIETESAPAVGTFSSKRQKPGAAKLGRWYYKTRPDTKVANAADDATSVPDSDPVSDSTSAPALMASDSAASEQVSSEQSEITDAASDEVQKARRTAPIRKISSKKPKLVKKLGSKPADEEESHVDQQPASSDSAAIEDVAESTEAHPADDAEPAVETVAEEVTEKPSPKPVSSNAAAKQEIAESTKARLDDDAEPTVDTVAEEVPKKPSSEPASESMLIQTSEHSDLPSKSTAHLEEDTGQPDESDNSDAAEEKAASSESETLSFNFQATGQPVRFTWEMDADHIFTHVSPEMAEAVGPAAADLEGLTWSETCSMFSLDNETVISDLLKKGDTWSGKTVLWPIQGTDLRAPIDLAGLPSYGRNRAFAGFNGFGIIRTADAVVDPDEIGLSLGDFDGDEPLDIPRTSETTSKTASTTTHRSLSTNEKEVFEEIGEKLGKTTRKESDRKASGKSTEKKKITAKVSKPKKKATPATSVVSISRKSEEVKNGTAMDETDQPSQTAKVSEAASDGTPASKISSDFIPSAFVKRKITTPEHDVDTSILSRLPIPVLVYRANELLFANRDFYKITGYENLAELAEAGGVDAIFGVRTNDHLDADAQLYDRDGNTLDLHANLQRVPWDEERAMLLTLRRRNPDDDRDRDNRPNGGPNGGPPTGPNDSGQTGEREPQTPLGMSSSSHILSPGSATDSHSDGANQPSSSARDPQAPPLASNVTPFKPRPSPPAEAIENPPQSKQSEAGAGSDCNISGSLDFVKLDGEDLRSIVDTASDGVVVLSANGVIRAMNGSAEALFDVRSSDIAGQSFDALVAPESRASATDYITSVGGSGIGSLLNDGREVIGRTSSGGLVPLFIAAGRMANESGLCVVLKDLTQWKKAEEELIDAKRKAEEISAQKSDFLTKVSHEIRTPLNAIIGFSDLMIEERFGPVENERYRGYLKDIHMSGKHVLELVNDLLDISKIEAGQMEVDFVACNLNVIVAECVAMSQPHANTERVIIRTSLSSRLPEVVADQRSLRQIIINLVTNALKFNNPGGQVIVSTVYDENSEVVLRVRDTGVGMGAEDLERALQPYGQVQPDNSGTMGSGLGLPLTKALVEANRARFHIESVPGEGTLVEIYFPSQRVLAER